MSRIFAICERELRALFESPVAYVTIALFVLVQAGLFFFVGYPWGRASLPSLWEGGEASLAVVFAWLPLLLAVWVPALTMSVWSEERRRGTETLLLTYPLRPVEAVLGKFLALWLLLGVLLSATLLPLAASVAGLGPLDWGVVVSAWIGSMAMVAGYVALALWVSAVSEEPLVAFLLAALALLALWTVGVLAARLPASELWLSVSPGPHFLEGAARGVLDAASLLYFAILTLLGLAGNTLVVARRREGPAPYAGPAVGVYARRRTQAWISLLLLLGIAFEANQLVGRHVHLRRDLSQDQLFTLAPATRRILGRLEDTLQVKAFFSRGIQNGAWQLQRSRIEAQLDELVRVSQGRLRVDYVDPGERADVLLEAEAYGISAQAVTYRVGTLQRSEPAFLGAVLRYRTDEAVLPILNARDVEVQVASQVQNLLREKAPVVAWAPGRGGRAAASFQYAASLLVDQGYELRELRRAEDWSEPADLFVLLGPRELGSDQVAALEAHVAGGGSVLLALDQVHVDATKAVTLVDTGLEDWLRERLGVQLTPFHVWDDFGKGVFYDWEGGRPRPLPYPLAVEVAAEGFASSVPATAGLQRASLFWSQTLEPLREMPAHITRQEVLLRSSAESYPVPRIERGLVLDEAAIDSRTATLYAAGDKGRSLPLGVLVERDSARVIALADSDLFRDAKPGFLNQRFLNQNRDNQRLLLNCVDWLASADTELMQLRVRQPRDRSLRDFDAEERKRAGLLAQESGLTVAALDRTRELEDEARGRAAWRRRWAMTWPSAATLMVLLGLGWWGNLRERRRPAWRPTASGGAA